MEVIENKILSQDINYIYANLNNKKYFRGHLNRKNICAAKLNNIDIADVGLKYDIKNVKFSPSNNLGTSNEVTGTKVLIELDGPGMIIILPQKCFKNVILKFNQEFLK